MGLASSHGGAPKPRTAQAEEPQGNGATPGGQTAPDVGGTFRDPEVCWYNCSQERGRGSGHSFGTRRPGPQGLWQHFRSVHQHTGITTHVCIHTHTHVCTGAHTGTHRERPSWTHACPQMFRLWAPSPHSQGSPGARGAEGPPAPLLAPASGRGQQPGARTRLPRLPRLRGTQAASREPDSALVLSGDSGEPQGCRAPGIGHGRGRLRRLTL